MDTTSVLGVKVNNGLCQALRRGDITHFLGLESQKPLGDLINRSYIQKLWDPHLGGTFIVKLRHKFSISAVKAARIRYLSNIAR